MLKVRSGSLTGGILGAIVVNEALAFFFFPHFLLYTCVAFQLALGFVSPARDGTLLVTMNLSREYFLLLSSPPT